MTAHQYFCQYIFLQKESILTSYFCIVDAYGHIITSSIHHLLFIKLEKKISTFFASPYEYKIFFNIHIELFNVILAHSLNIVGIFYFFLPVFKKTVLFKHIESWFFQLNIDQIIQLLYHLSVLSNQNNIKNQLNQQVTRGNVVTFLIFVFVMFSLENKLQSFVGFLFPYLKQIALSMCIKHPEGICTRFLL
ncbi:hypothetical protein RFI_34855 [Reticulomyxa filosa]|uniref:Transmembrane protein n=1 Tax=Reticulomyxa filosa TaxID=46433 RepID=X6LKU1_RETFI|nr:hypothetical protein RFI_34855 [Reticulomyxa filosa]|eukprot:ETO02563.1 hypothetical protein RFI_34855 [Reticulomyxa filosa]